MTTEQKLGPLPEPTIRTAHDVRHLRGCEVCRQIGDDRTMVDLEGEWYHGRCFVKSHGISELLALPRPKRDRLTLGDVGRNVMRALVDCR